MGAAMGPTTEAERRLAITAGSGGEADCSGLSGEDEKIRPEFLRALMLGMLKDKEGEAIRPQGAVRLSGATITGKLDLSLLGSSGAPLPGLILRHCKIDGEADFSGARIGEVDLNLCHLKGFRAPRAHIDGHLMLVSLTLPEDAAIDLDDAVITHRMNIESCTAERETKKDAALTDEAAAQDAPRLGTITLSDASIGGALSLKHLCCCGHKRAIDAENLVLAGRATVSYIDTVGVVSFFGAKIGGQLNIVGASLSAKVKGLAFNAQGADIGGDVFLHEKTTAQGEVSFAGAKIGGVLTVSGATLTAGRNGMAFNAQGADIDGGVFLNQGTTAQGEVRFLGAKIDRQMEISGATLTATDSGYALNLQSASVGSLFIRDEARKEDRAPVTITGTLFAPALTATNAIHIDAETGKDGERCLVLDGVLDFRDLRAGAFTLTEATLRPHEKTAELFNAHAVDADLILRLSHAEIANRLRIRLDDTSERRRGKTAGGEMSKGVVDLRGAKAGTLDDDWNRGWAAEPKQEKDRIESGVACLLDGFVYDSIAIDGAHPPPPGQGINFLQRLWEWFFRADRALIETRLGFINRMYRGEAPKPENFFPQPYRELASTLRDMGRGIAARSILLEMEDEWKKVSHNSAIGRCFDYLFGFTFGFGYSGWRAFRTIVILWVIATGGFCIAEKYERLGQFLNEPRVTSIYSSPPRASATSSVAAKGARPEALKKIFRDEQGPYDWAPACEAPPWLYAIDTMLPIIDLGIESGCGFLDAAWGWQLFKLFVAIAGAVAIPLAALTFAGLLQRA